MPFSSITCMATGNTQIKTTGKCLWHALIWKDGEGEGGTLVEVQKPDKSNRKKNYLWLDLTWKQKLAHKVKKNNTEVIIFPSIEWGIKEMEISLNIRQILSEKRSNYCGIFFLVLKNDVSQNAFF